MQGEQNSSTWVFPYVSRPFMPSLDVIFPSTTAEQGTTVLHVSGNNCFTSLWVNLGQSHTCGRTWTMGGSADTELSYNGPASQRFGRENLTTSTNCYGSHRTTRSRDRATSCQTTCWRSGAFFGCQENALTRESTLDDVCLVSRHDRCLNISILR